MNTPGYESLAHVLKRAYDQAASGKGAERHACNRPFTEQPMQAISGLLGSPDGLLYQAMKKVQESKRLDKDAGVRELLGAINYLAGAIIFIEMKAAPLICEKDDLYEAIVSELAPQPGVYVCSGGRGRPRHGPYELACGTPCLICHPTTTLIHHPV